jgi:hypothetical protein
MRRRGLWRAEKTLVAVGVPLTVLLYLLGDK